MIDVILHIGRHKTGTSSLQVYLDKSSKKLMSDNYIYPRMFYRVNAHHLIGERLKKSITDKLTDKEVTDLTHNYRRKIVRRFKHRNKTLIFSSESFQNCDPKVIRQVFNPKMFNVRVICYFRDQVSYYCSAYNQRAHANFFYDDVNRFYNQAFDGDYMKFSDSWSEFFPNFECRVFERSQLYQNDIVSDFCKKILNTEAVDLDTGLSNPSLSRRYLAFKLLLNKQVSEGSLSLKINDRQLYRILGELSDADNSGKYILPTTLSDNIRARYSEQNKLFSQKYLNNLELNFPTQTTDTIDYSMDESEFESILSKIIDLAQPAKA